jgi:hypothetical protein
MSAEHKVDPAGLDVWRSARGCKAVVEASTSRSPSLTLSGPSRLPIQNDSDGHKDFPAPSVSD